MKKLDDKGRCCGRKPIVYKREGFKYCDRCHMAFCIDTCEQIPNLAWKHIDGTLTRVDVFGNPRTPRMEVK